MKCKASTTVNEPREVKKRLLVKSVLLAIIIVMCLPLLRTPGEYVKERRDWTFGELLYEEKVAPDTYAVFFTWFDGLISCELVRNEWFWYEYMDTINIAHTTGNIWVNRNWENSRDFESRGKTYTITCGLLTAGSERPDAENITFMELSEEWTLYFYVTEAGPG